MRQIGKRILIILAIAGLLAGLAGCSEQRVYTPEELQNETALQQSAAAMMQDIVALSEEEIDEIISEYEYEQDVVMANGFNSWKSSREDLGGLVGIRSTECIRTSGNGYRAVILAQFEKRDCEFVVAVDERMQKLTELTFNPVYSLGEKLRQAGINLVIGMGTVFAVLVFLTWIISLFRHIDPARKKMEAARAAKAGGAPEAQAVRQVPAEAAAALPPVVPAGDGAELLAVIAAAVAAYEADTGRSGSIVSIVKQPALNNGLTVRSFRRVSRKQAEG